jgi:hypothetical protein
MMVSTKTNRKISWIVNNKYFQVLESPNLS